MTNGTSQGLFTIIAVIIFGLFVGLSYILFQDKLQTGLSTIFTESIDKTYKIVKEEPSGENENPIGGFNKNVTLYDSSSLLSIDMRGISESFYPKNEGGEVVYSNIENNNLTINIETKRKISVDYITKVQEHMQINLYSDSTNFSQLEDGDEKMLEVYSDKYNSYEMESKEWYKYYRLFQSYMPVYNHTSQVNKYTNLMGKVPNGFSENAFLDGTIRINKLDDLKIDGVSVPIKDSIPVSKDIKKLEMIVHHKLMNGQTFNIHTTINYI